MFTYESFTKKSHNDVYPAIDPKRPELTAAGKFVVVTGGATGIGRAAAVAFAQAGASTIAILGRRLDRLEQTAGEIAAQATAKGAQVLFESADVGDRAGLDAAVARLINKAGGPSKKIDVLVHSAGVLPDMGPVVGYDAAQLRLGLDLNVVGAFNVVQAFAPLLAEQGATVINISSGLGHVLPVAEVPIWAYSMTKAAVIRMFDQLQAENPGWRVVQVQPGVVATELNARYPIEGQDTPELGGQFAVWLASPEAAFLKSKFVWVNWDVDELKARAKEIEGSLLLRVLLKGVEV